MHRARGWQGKLMGVMGRKGGSVSGEEEAREALSGRCG